METPLILTIQPTSRLVEVDGIQTRIWEGITPDQQHVICFISLVALHPDADQSAFEQQLRAVRYPSRTAERIAREVSGGRP